MAYISSSKRLAMELALDHARLIRDKGPGNLDPRNCSPYDTCAEHLCWMCGQIVANKDSWSVARMHRWLGYVQCGIRFHEWMSPDELRDLVRRKKQIHPEEDLYI